MSNVQCRTLALPRLPAAESESASASASASACQLLLLLLLLHPLVSSRLLLIFNRFCDAPPSPNTSHSSLSNKSGISNDKRYLQLPSITTFALSPTGLTSTPPLTSSDAASCSTTTCDSGHSLISSWSQSQSQAQQPYVHGLIQTGSWGRASHRPRGASTSSFRSLPPLSATPPATTASPKPYYRPRGAPAPPSLVSCEGCQTTLDVNEWSSHKRSCRAYARVQQQIDSLAYHHSYSRSQPATILPPLITTTSPNSEASHVEVFHPSRVASASGSISCTRETLDASYEASKSASLAHKRTGDSTRIPGVTSPHAHADSLLRDPSRSSSAQEHIHRYSPPRLSINAMYSLQDPAPASSETKRKSQSAHSHLLLPHSFRISHENPYDSPRVHRVDYRSPTSIQSHLLGTDSRDLLKRKVNSDCLNVFRSSSRASSQSQLEHSPTSTKSSSGIYSLKITDLCHPGPPRSPDSDPSSGSPDQHRLHSWFVSRSRYLTRPTPSAHHSSEDNSTTPTHIPLPRTSTLSSGHTVQPRSNAFRPFHLTSYDSHSSNIRQVQYTYSQSRSTFQFEPDSDSESISSDSEDEQNEKLRRISRQHSHSPLRSISPPSPYISDA